MSNQTRKPSSWIILNPETGDRFCKDRIWRYVALFGTPSFCVKKYSRRGFAQRMANRYMVGGKTELVALYPGDTMDASGRITRVE